MLHHLLGRRWLHQQLLLLLPLQQLLLHLTPLPQHPLRRRCRQLRQLHILAAHACHRCDLCQPNAAAGVTATAAVWWLPLVPTLRLLLEHCSHEGSICLAADGRENLQHWAALGQGAASGGMQGS